MDPLSALSLAACIIQFIDFGMGLVSDAYEIAHSSTGATRCNDDLEGACATLNILIDELKILPGDIAQLSNRVPEEVVLITTAAKCRATANELHLLLENLQSRGTKCGISYSLRQALRLAFSKRKLEELENKLVLCRSELSTCLNVIIRYGFFQLHVKVRNLTSCPHKH